MQLPPCPVWAKIFFAIFPILASPIFVAAHHVMPYPKRNGSRPGRAKP